MKFEPAVVWRRNEERRRNLGTSGKVVSFSVVRQGPEQLKVRTPYVVALIKTKEELVITQLTDVLPEEVSLGMRVVGVMRRLFDVDSEALHVYGVKFVPLGEQIVVSI